MECPECFSDFVPYPTDPDRCAECGHLVFTDVDDFRWPKRERDTTPDLWEELHLDERLAH